MVIGARTIVGAAAALAVVGAVLWGSALLLEPSTPAAGSVEVAQVPEPAWAVEIKDLSGTEARSAEVRTAANR